MKPRFNKPMQMIIRLLLLGILAVIAALVVGYLGFLHPALDTIANFRAHFFAALLVLAQFSIFAFGRIVGAGLLLAGLLGLYLTIGKNWFVDPYHTTANLQSEKIYTLVQLNLYFANPTPEKVFKFIDEINPDILTLNELSRSWESRLKVLDADYPHSFHCPEWTLIGGSIIYSRFAFIGNAAKCREFAALGTNVIHIDGVDVTIGAVHLRWPWPASGPRQVDALEPMLNNLGPNAIIAGDFNSAPWTWLVRRFASYGNLKIVDYSGASWIYRALPTALANTLGLPLDNVLVKGRIKVLDAKAAKPVGSDHLPLIIRFRVD